MQAVFGVSLLEAVNYTEHYGLKRARLDNGRYRKANLQPGQEARLLAQYPPVAV